MATIKISDLRPAGLDLLSDNESYMMDLSEEELAVAGGISWTIAIASSKGCILASVFVATVVSGWLRNR